MELIARYGGLPEALAPFCEAAPMQRLRQIGMHCGCEYTTCPIYEGKAPYTRYLHSLGAAAIVWHFTKDAAQSLSALFHDIATPAFAHVVDFLNEDHLRQESTEAPTHEILAGNMQIQALLRPLGLCTHDVDDYHRYPIADNDSPRLSSDRLEYTLGNAYRVFGAPPGEISAVYGNLFAAEAEDGLCELSFRDLEAAQTFSRWSLRQSQWFVSDDDRFQRNPRPLFIGDTDTGADIRGQIADLRTSAGTEDNSGDYTDYPAVTELTVGTVTAELRGEAAERYTLAVWTDGQYAYSLRLSDGQSTEVWQRLLAGVRTEG